MENGEKEGLGRGRVNVCIRTNEENRGWGETQGREKAPESLQDPRRLESLMKKMIRGDTLFEVSPRPPHPYLLVDLACPCYTRRKYHGALRDSATVAWL